MAVGGVVALAVGAFGIVADGIVQSVSLGLSYVLFIGLFNTVELYPVKSALYIGCSGGDKITVGVNAVIICIGKVVSGERNELYLVFKSRLIKRLLAG